MELVDVQMREIRDPIVIDGSHGEGGGQILRTLLALSAIVQRPVTVERIRAGRSKPGLAAQHLTAIRAAQQVCAAKVEGATLGSNELVFRPTAPPTAGDYRFDVTEAREGGSAGSATLVLQTIAIPAVFALGTSQFRIMGGTHVPWSPCFEYVSEVWLPLLRRIGIDMTAELARPGFFPLGGGEIGAVVNGLGKQARRALKPLAIIDRGALKVVRGVAMAANLPMHIPERMADRARGQLSGTAPRIDIEAKQLKAASAGAQLILIAEFENINVGFTAMGRRGRTSEAVADEAVTALQDHARRGAALDSHLADQVLLPLALARESSAFTCPGVTAHLETNAWVIEQFGIASIRIEPHGDATRVTVVPRR
jgi:RNA 3'-terminal phosphate cyclase (ATP)